MFPLTLKHMLRMLHTQSLFFLILRVYVSLVYGNIYPWQMSLKYLENQFVTDIDVSALHNALRSVQSLT